MMMPRRPPAAAALLLLFAGTAYAEAACDAPAAVCAARGAVFAVSSFDPLASAVLVAPGLLVTNRHVVADETQQQALAPGSARQRLADALDAEELPAGDKATP